LKSAAAKDPAIGKGRRIARHAMEVKGKYFIMEIVAVKHAEQLLGRRCVYISYRTCSRHAFFMPEKGETISWKDVKKHGN
jgi:hypothetical protein